MKQPSPLRYDQDPIMAEARDLLARARPSRPMTALEDARCRRRVMKLSALSLGATLWFYLKGVAFGASVGVVSVVVASRAVPLLRELSAAPQSAGSVMRIGSMPVGVASATPSAALSELPAVPSAPSTVSPRATVVADPPIAPIATVGSAIPPAVDPQDSLQSEITMLEQAHQQLVGNPARALSLADSHSAKFPNGKLSVERELVAVNALRRLGRSTEAHARGQVLLSRAKGTIYEERVSKLLAEMGP